MFTADDFPLPSLDSFARCDTPGCRWDVQLPERKCSDHGGRPVPQILTDHEWGDGFQQVRHIPGWPVGSPL